MKHYEEPTVEIAELTVMDIIATSNENQLPAI